MARGPPPVSDERIPHTQGPSTVCMETRPYAVSPQVRSRSSAIHPSARREGLRNLRAPPARTRELNYCPRTRSSRSSRIGPSRAATIRALGQARHSAASARRDTRCCRAKMRDVRRNRPHARRRPCGPGRMTPGTRAGSFGRGRLPRRPVSAHPGNAFDRPPSKWRGPPNALGGLRVHFVLLIGRRFSVFEPRVGGKRPDRIGKRVVLVSDALA